jgi:hypothetical protein
MERLVYSKRFAGSTREVAVGILRRREAELPAGARLQSEMVFADPTAFREDGTIVFDAENALHFRTLGTGPPCPLTEPGSSPRHRDVGARRGQRTLRGRERAHHF